MALMDYSNPMMRMGSTKTMEGSQSQPFMPPVPARNQMTAALTPEMLALQRAPQARRVISRTTGDAMRYAGMAGAQMSPLMRFGNLAAFNEQQALLGLAGPDAQREALANIQLSPAQEEANRRQSETLMRQAAASGDISGYSLMRAGQLGAEQGMGAVQDRLAALEPLAATARGVRSDLASQAEASRMLRAQLMEGRGAKLGNIMMGTAAPSIGALQTSAELSGLQGISSAQQQAQMGTQLAQLAGMFGSYFGQ